MQARPWLSLLAMLCLAPVLPLRAADRPHILWITIEDLSPAWGCYGDPDARTPNLDAFAREAVRYTHAFASAPVCSPARSSLITGMWAPSLGTSQMRSSFPLPPEVKGFPSCLREAGYYTTNRVKTDYNTSDERRLIEESWDESSSAAHWRSGNRAPDQPFFAVFNHMVTHQSRTMVWSEDDFVREVQSKLPPELRHDPDTLRVPPYYPDTPRVRRELARFHDCVSALDLEVGELLRQLEEDGLAEDTLVFIFSDHGSGMPRHKRLLHDSGMRVPLLVRFPEKYRHLAPAAPGGTVDRLVTFVDFAPTVLSLAGLPKPEGLQGDIFLGPEASAPPEFVYGFRDRIDEVFDLSRSVRSPRYLYIRNHLPHLSWAQRSVYSDEGAIQQELFRYAAENPDRLSKAQAAYLSPTRPVEEFYDVEADPENLVNLLEGELSEAQQEALDIHRRAYVEKRREILDLGALPEPFMVSWIVEEERSLREIALGRTNHRPDLERIWAAADLVGRGSREALLECLHDGDSVVRYWGLVGLRAGFPEDPDLHESLVDFIDDYQPSVRIEAASWLAEFSPAHRGEALAVLAGELVAEEWWTALPACRAVERLGEKAATLLPVMEALYTRNRQTPGDGALFLAFSSGAFLKAMGLPILPWEFGPMP